MTRGPEPTLSQLTDRAGVTPALRSQVIDCWTEVANAGGPLAGSAAPGAGRRARRGADGPLPALSPTAGALDPGQLATVLARVGASRSTAPRWSTGSTRTQARASIRSR